MTDRDDSTLKVILDVDGTLVDTNYQHAIAWHRALRAHGHTVQLWEIHRHIGMGGDQLVEALIGEKGERSDGDAIRGAGGRCLRRADRRSRGDARRHRAAAGAARGRRATLILASSAKKEEVEHYIELLDAGELIDGWTSGADVERTKPHPDLVHAALEKAG